MSRDDIRTADRETTAAAADAAPGSPLSMLAAAGRPGDLLPHLHQHAIDRVGGRSAILFRQNPRNGALQATSGFNLETLRADPWLPAGEEAMLLKSAFAQRAPIVVADAGRRMPDLAGRLGMPGATLLPRGRGRERVGLLAVGVPRPPAAEPQELAEIGDLFLVALELLHLRQSDALQRDVRALLEEFASSLSAARNLTACLDALCHGANVL